MPRRSLVLPPAPAGGLGDDGLVRGAISGLASVGTEARVIEVGRPWYADAITLRSTAATPTWVPMAPRRAANKATELYVERRATEVYALFADVLDGFYGERSVLAKLAHLQGLGLRGTRLHLVGFSWENGSPSIVEALRGLPNARFSTRDPISTERFHADTGLPVQRGADLAYLVPQVRAAPAQIASQVANWRQQGMSVLGITPNALWRQRAPGMFDGLVALVNHPEMRDVGFVLVPHDRRDNQDDHLFAEQILAASPSAASRIVLPEVPDFPASRGLLQLVDVHLAGRMHSGISAMSVTTPALMISLQQKMLGILEDAGQDGSAVSPDQIPDTEEFVGVVRAALAGFATRQEALAGNLPAIRRRALSGLLGTAVEGQ